MHEHYTPLSSAGALLEHSQPYYCPLEWLQVDPRHGAQAEYEPGEAPRATVSQIGKCRKKSCQLAYFNRGCLSYDRKSDCLSGEMVLDLSVSLISPTSQTSGFNIAPRLSGRVMGFHVVLLDPSTDRSTWGDPCPRLFIINLVGRLLCLHSKSRKLCRSRWLRGGFTVCRFASALPPHGIKTSSLDSLAVD